MKKQITLATLFSLFCSIASAHPGHGLGSAYAGFMHPLTGWDHLLVMLAIGVWAAKLGGKARWQLPLTFVVVMALGAGLGFSGFVFSGLETAIVASVMAMGLLLVINLPIPAISRIGIVALFAVFHGMAHGIELHSQSGLGALGGMLMATALLHGAGLLIGMQRAQLAKWLHTGLAWLMLFTGSYLLLS